MIKRVLSICLIALLSTTTNTANITVHTPGLLLGTWYSYQSEYSDEQDCCYPAGTFEFSMEGKDTYLSVSNWLGNCADLTTNSTPFWIPINASASLIELPQYLEDTDWTDMVSDQHGFRYLAEGFSLVTGNWPNGSQKVTTGFVLVESRYQWQCPIVISKGVSGKNLNVALGTIFSFVFMLVTL